METKPNAFKSALIPGIIISAIGIVYFLIQYVFNIKPIGFMMPILILIIGFGINISLLVYYLKIYRKNLGGFMTIGEGFIFGFISLTVSSIITSIFTLIFIQFIEPNYMVDIMNSQKEWMQDFMSGKLSEEEIEKALAQIDAKTAEMTPIKQTLQTFGYGIFGSALISIIVAAIMKKRQNPFETETLD